MNNMIFPLFFVLIEYTSDGVIFLLQKTKNPTENNLHKN